MANLRLDYSQKMQQQLRLSPQMIQSVELLRLPVAELCDRVYQEAEKNPAIEIIKDADLSVRTVTHTKGITHSNASDVFQSFLENTAGHEESLQEHLLLQLSLLDISEAERNVGERIIQNLDAHGFFNTEPRNLLYPHETSDLLSRVLTIVRSFDPPGIAFSNVQESLVFQAELQEDCPPLVLEIVKNYFYVLEKKRPAPIKKYLNNAGIACTIEEIEAALNYIRTLEPYPARQFNAVGSTVQYVIPDVTVRKIEDSEDNNDASAFVIEFLKGSLPEITLSPVYTSLLDKKNASKENYQFAVNSVQNAKQFMNALEYRITSLYSAIQVIVVKQQEFFYKGPGNLVPLRQKDVAEEIGMHEATISRIANGKYLQCDWGIFELKYFFTNAVQTQIIQGSEQVLDSKESIKHQIGLIIKENEKLGGKKLSDSKLAKILEQQGITIARRTVAKYRSELNIESSFDRL